METTDRLWASRGMETVSRVSALSRLGWPSALRGRALRAEAVRRRTPNASGLSLSEDPDSKPAPRFNAPKRRR